MAGRGARRPDWSQHFLRRGALARSLVEQAELSRNDLVVEVGAGRGALTRELAPRCARVVALELDPSLCAELRSEFSAHADVEVVHGDARTAALPGTPYKVLGNLPFTVTSELVRRFVEGAEPPSDVFVIVQREAAQRFVGAPFAAESRTSLSWKPWWHAEILRPLRRTDFDPAPRVETVWLWLSHRERGLLPDSERVPYRDFVAAAFGRRGNHVADCCRGLLSPRQLARLAHDLRFSPAMRPSELRFDQWLALYRFFARTAEPAVRRRLIGAQGRLPRQPGGPRNSSRRR